MQAKGALYALLPNPYDYGSLVVGTSATQTFTLTNAGGAGGGMFTATLAGTAASDFAIVRDTCSGTSLPGASYCEVDVTFTPTILGERPGILRLSMLPGGTLSAGLTGTGT